MSEIAPKSLADCFSDWETEAIGFGYGTGEQHTIPALKMFLAAAPGEGTYDYRVLEAAVGGASAWFLISILCKQNNIEYGTSPRFGWLTRSGRVLKTFVDSKTTDELQGFACRDSDYIPCSRDSCNCGPRGYVKGRNCPNPFWGRFADTK